jgi:hypothetical protein
LANPTYPVNFLLTIFARGFSDAESFSILEIPFEYGFDVVPFISGDVGAALAGGRGEATIKRKLSEDLLKVAWGVLSQTTTLDQGIGRGTSTINHFKEGMQGITSIQWRKEGIGKRKRKREKKKRREG